MICVHSRTKINHQVTVQSWLLPEQIYQDIFPQSPTRLPARLATSRNLSRARHPQSTSTPTPVHQLPLHILSRDPRRAQTALTTIDLVHLGIFPPRQSTKLPTDCPSAFLAGRGSLFPVVSLFCVQTDCSIITALLFVSTPIYLFCS